MEKKTAYFLYAYSNKCAAFIPDSVTIEFQTVETTTDGYGNELSSIESGLAEYITLEKSLEPRFMAYNSANRLNFQIHNLKQVLAMRYILTALLEMNV